MKLPSRPVLIVAAAICVLGGAAYTAYRAELGAAAGNRAPEPDHHPSIEAEPPVRSLAARVPVEPLAKPLWRPVDESEVTAKPRFAPDWSRTGRTLVDVSAAVAMAPAWRVGDRVGIEVPQLGERFESIIDRIDEGADGRSRSARGVIAGDDGLRRRFVVTVGPMHVFAYIDTTNGPFELVGNNRLGWLLPTSSLMAGWDFSDPDYFISRRDGGRDGR